jgi:hypothetical protein
VRSDVLLGRLPVALYVPTLVCCDVHRYVILPKDFEKGYRANVKKGDAEFAFYQ